jgi:glycosyltransferase involved in cell wall biosynthesis
MTRVLFITRVVQTYREPFHNRVREILAGQGITYDVAHGEAEELHELKKDTVRLPWAHVVRNRFIGPHCAKVMWQPMLGEARRSDLVIVGQENKYLLNYLLQLGRGTLFRKVALWGHGRNFQARRPGSPSERWKRFWATRCDWWFAYTDATRRHLESLGFPPERITVFNNAVDTGALREIADTVTDEEIAERTAALGIRSGNIAVFVGGLYPDKRIEFLVEAADRVRRQVPDFTLLVLGGGVDRQKLDALAESRSWVIVAGPRHGREKVVMMRAAKLFLMPGLVGLAVLDAGAVGLPMVTTAYPYHSPEIAYLQDGANGVIVPDWQDVDAYADAVVELLRDEARCVELAEAARTAASRYTIEAMAERFAAGVVAALGKRR